MVGPLRFSGIAYSQISSSRAPASPDSRTPTVSCPRARRSLAVLGEKCSSSSSRIVFAEPQDLHRRGPLCRVVLEFVYTAEPSVDFLRIGMVIRKCQANLGDRNLEVAGRCARVQPVPPPDEYDGGDIRPSYQLGFPRGVPAHDKTKDGEPQDTDVLLDGSLDQFRY